MAELLNFDSNFRLTGDHIFVPDGPFRTPEKSKSASADVRGDFRGTRERSGKMGFISMKFPANFDFQEVA